MELRLLNNVTDAEKAAMCGLSDEEVERLERLRADCKNGCTHGPYNDEFYFLIIDKLIDKYRPKYTYQDIVDMHRHL